MPRGVTQTKAGTFQLCVKHKLLSKPFYHSFPTEEEADTYGTQLRALLARGVVPIELLEKAPNEGRITPLLVEVMRAYEKDPQTRVAATELPTLALLAKETVGLRMSGITFVWANELISSYKAKKLAPGTIRKRIGALGRVDAWYHRQQAVKGQQPQMSVLELLPRGYSQYVDGSVKDIQREIRLSPKYEEAIRGVLSGAIAEDKERAWGADPVFELFFTLIVETGIRLKEAYWLRVSDLDAARGVLNIRGTKGHHGQIKPRVVPLKKGIRERLVKWCDGKTGVMFPYWDGTPEDLKKCSARLSARFTSLFAYAKVPDFKEHDLRHEACCRWVQLKSERGWVFNDIEICKIMGWSNTAMMLRYASLRGEDLADRLL